MIHHVHPDVHTAEAGYGEAITSVYDDDDGHFWVSNDEYASQVNYCPVCGAKAPTPAEPWKPRSAR